MSGVISCRRPCKLDTVSGCEYQGMSPVNILMVFFSISSTVRPGKVEAMKLQFENKVEVVSISDLVEGDYSDALKGE